MRRWAESKTTGAVALITLFVLLCGLPMTATAQSQPPSVVPGAGVIPDAPGKTASSESGLISGTIIDPTGAVTVGAKVRLTRQDQAAGPEVVSGDNGQYSFGHVAPGPYTLTVSAPGFTTESYSGELAPSQAVIVPPIMLNLATAVTEVSVSLTQVEVAEEQIKEQEKQRVFGFIPNFYVSYLPDAAPMSSKQKFKLAWRSSTDPVTFLGVGVLAGIEQGSNDFSGYGQGMQGYAKRFGAAYADNFSGTFIGSAILPSLLKQDPRYFYQTSGTAQSRFWHALANGVMCKSDDKRWQPNYSVIAGSFATAGLSYLYYPASDRNASLFLQNSLIRIAESSIAGIFQQYVGRRLTPRLPPLAPETSSSAFDQAPAATGGK